MTMKCDTTFYNVYQEVFNICMDRQLSFTKYDVDMLPPFERSGYIDLINKYYEELEIRQEEQRRKSK